MQGDWHIEHTKDPVVQDLGYSTEELLFHQDLVYYESPPGIQLLHCVKSVTLYTCSYVGPM